MNDFQRVNQLYLDFLSSARIHEGHGASEWSEPLKSLRIRYWFEVLRQRTALNNPYQMEMNFEPESFVRNPDGSIRHYKNKWTLYKNGKNLPRETLLEKVEKKVPGSTRELHHPLWLVLDLQNTQIMEGDAFLHQLAPAVRDILFIPAREGMLGYLLRVPVTELVLEKLERRACLDVLAGLTWLLREAAKRQSGDAVMIGHALHNVLTMMALELYALKIALPLLQLFIDRVLPLGLPSHHRLGMSPIDYMHSSGHLYRLIYITPKGGRRTLDWIAKVKIMQQLLQGKFGFDVRFAMRQKFELDNAGGEVPADIVSAFDRTSKLNAWGWLCVQTGLRFPLPSFH
jgi:hypothetical protein